MKKEFKIFLGAIAIVFVFWGGCWFLATHSSILNSWTIRGQFGDLFGSINALFSGLAFAGLIFTIFLQKEELSLQRDELKLQREEMSASRQELKAQVKAQTDLVSAQRNMVHATIAQIRVAAIQAGNKVDSGSSRKASEDQIEKIAEKLEDLVLKSEELLERKK